MSSQAFINLVFAIFCVVFFFAVLRKGGWTAEAVSWKRLISGYVVGLVVTPACWLLFRGDDGRVEHLQVRAALAIGVTLGVAALIAKAGPRAVRYSPVALFGFLGMLTVPFIVLVFVAVACVGETDCLHTQ